MAQRRPWYKTATPDAKAALNAADWRRTAEAALFRSSVDPSRGSLPDLIEQYEKRARENPILPKSPAAPSTGGPLGPMGPVGPERGRSGIRDAVGAVAREATAPARLLATLPFAVLDRPGAREQVGEDLGSIIRTINRPSGALVGAFSGEDAVDTVRGAVEGFREPFSEGRQGRDMALVRNIPRTTLLSDALSLTTRNLGLGGRAGSQLPPTAEFTDRDAAGFIGEQIADPTNAALPAVGGAGIDAARAAGRGARVLNALDDVDALRAAAPEAFEIGRGRWDDTFFPRSRIAGGAPFSEDELFAQMAHIDREISSNPNLTSAIAKIQDNIKIEEELRSASGPVRAELKAGRKRQALGASDARTWAVENRATLREAAQAAAEETTTGGNRVTFAPGADLTDDESRAIAHLLATSPALEGKPLTYRNYVNALADFLDGKTIQPEQRQRLSDLLGVNLESKTNPAVGARPDGTPAQYPARITGERQAPVVQTFRNEPQQEMAGLARIVGSDGNVKEGVIQPSLLDPDTYSIVDPKTGYAIPDFREDGTVIPGSEIRRSSEQARSFTGPHEFPSTVGMENAPRQTGLDLGESPLEGAQPTPRLPGETDAQYRQRLDLIQRRRAAENRMGAGGIGSGSNIETRRATHFGAGGDVSGGGPNRGRQIGLPGVQRLEQQRGTLWQNVKDGLSGIRMVQSSDIMSLAFRQGRRTILPHNKSWRRAVKENIKAFFSEERAWRASDAVDASPNRARYDEMGIDLPTPDNYDLSVQEEAFLHGSSATARAIQRIPLVKPAERGAATFMRVLRAGMADDIIDLIGDDQWVRMSPLDKRALGDIINAGTGRGKVPEIAKGSVQGLNTIFYSARNQIANVQVPASMFFGRNSAVRKEAAKLYVSDLLVKWAIRGLWVAGGGKVGTDILSSDWSKLITDDGQRIDLDGGDAQLARVVANMVAGGSTSRSTGKFTKRERRDIAWDYLRSKFAPVPSTIDRLTDDEPNESVPEEVMRVGAYMWLQDLAEAVQSAKSRGATPLGAARMSLTSLIGSQVGIGVQSDTGALGALDKWAETQTFIDENGVEQRGENFSSLPPSVKERAPAELAARLDQGRGEAGGESARYVQLKGEFRSQQEASDQMLASREITKAEWRQSYTDRQRLLGARRDELFSDRELQNDGGVLSSYFEQIDSAVQPDGSVDWDAVEEWRASLTPQQDAYITQNTSLGTTEQSKSFEQFRKKVAASGLWDIRDGAWEQAVSRIPDGPVKAEIAQYDSYDDYRRDAAEQFAERLESRGIPYDVARERADREVQNLPALQLHSTLVQLANRAWASKNPELAAEAIAYGYLTSSKANVGAATGVGIGSGTRKAPTLGRSSVLSGGRKSPLGSSPLR